MRNYIFYFCATLLLFSCGNKDNRSLQDNVSAFINNNDSIVVFGKIDYGVILNKTDYKNAPKIGPIVSSVLGEFEKGINSNEPIYLALSGPFNNDGSPKKAYAFLSVVNADSLVGVMTKKGYDLDKEEDLYYTQLDDLSIGVKNGLAILIFGKGEVVPLDKIKEVFLKTQGDISKGKKQEILSSKGDIVFGYNIENVYNSSNTELEKLNDELKNEIKDMVRDSYGEISFHFEKGQAKMILKNYFSDKLKEQLFFKNDAKGEIVKKLGKGSPRIGISMNIDMMRFQNFINKYAPGAIDQFAKSLGGPAQMALMMGGEDALSGLLSGELGLVMFGEPDGFGATVPSFNTYVGFGKKGKSLAEMGVSLLEQNNIKTIIDNKGLSCFSSPEYISNDENGLLLPNSCQFYGKKSFTGFMNLEGMDLSSFHLSGGSKLIELLESVQFQFDENGGELILKTINKDDNVMKQSVDFMLKEFESQINAMPF